MGWHIGNRYEMKFFLETILPYSIVKKSQILLGLKFLEKTTTSKGGRGTTISSEEQKFRESYIDKFKEPKHHIYTEDEIKHIKYLINNTTHSQKEFDETVYAYITGFFDGEGVVGAYKDKRDDSILLYISLPNTNPYVLIGMKQVFDGNIYIRKKPEKYPDWRQQWIWNITDKDKKEYLLKKILPYSIVKKQQIELGLKFLKTNDYQTKVLIADRLKEMKDIEYTDEEIKILNEQIKEMNVDKLQKTMMDF